MVAGGDFSGPVIIRYEADGDLDPTFDGDGLAAPAVAGLVPDRVKVQADGKIFVAGYRQSPMRVTLIRLTAAGALDPTFGAAGIFEMNVGESLALYGNQRRGPGLALGPGDGIVVAATQSSATVESILLLRLLRRDPGSFLRLPRVRVDHGAGRQLDRVRPGGAAGRQAGDRRARLLGHGRRRLRPVALHPLSRRAARRAGQPSSTRARSKQARARAARPRRENISPIPWWGADQLGSRSAARL